MGYVVSLASRAMGSLGLHTVQDAPSITKRLGIDGEAFTSLYGVLLGVAELTHRLYPSSPGSKARPFAGTEWSAKKCDDFPKPLVAVCWRFSGEFNKQEKSPAPHVIVPVRRGCMRCYEVLATSHPISLCQYSADVRCYEVSVF